MSGCWTSLTPTPIGASLFGTYGRFLWFFGPPSCAAGLLHPTVRISQVSVAPHDQCGRDKGDFRPSRVRFLRKLLAEIRSDWPYRAENPASRDDKITRTSALVRTKGGDMMMLFPDTRTIAPDW